MQEENKFTDELIRKHFEEAEKLKEKFYTADEIIRILNQEGTILTINQFNNRVKKIDMNKEIGLAGLPRIIKEAPDGKGRPANLYNHAILDAIRTMSFSNTFVKVEEEEPIDFFVNDEWKEILEEELKKYLNGYKMKLNEYDIDDIIIETLSIVNKIIIKKYYALAGQNKYLIHRNRSLEKTKEHLLKSQAEVEQNANVLKNIKNYIEYRIDESDKMLTDNTVEYARTLFDIHDSINRISNDIKKISMEE